jgi:O-antigen ligase
MYQWICRFWLPAGFLLFLTGLFLAPSAHNYKVIINYMLLLPGLVATCAVRKWWPQTPPNRTLLLLVFVYLSYMAINAYWQNAQAGVEFTQWSFYILVFLIAGGLCMNIQRSSLTQLLWLGVIAAAAAAIYAITRDLKSGAMLQPGYRLIGYGALYNPLRSAHLFGVFLIAAVWCATLTRLHGAQRWSAAICAVVILATMLLTGSRSPLLALLILSLWLVAVAVPRKRQLHYLGGLLLVTIPSLCLFWSELLARGWSLRPELWTMSAKAALEQPWFGVGLGNRIVLDSATGLQFYDTHNVFLAVLYYGGLCGLLLFAALFGYAFYSAWSRRFDSPLFGLAATLQVYGLATLQFDGGSLIGRPTEFWLLYWLPIVVTLHADRTRYEYRDNHALNAR